MADCGIGAQQSKFETEGMGWASSTHGLGAKMARVCIESTMANGILWLRERAHVPGCAPLNRDKVKETNEPTLAACSVLLGFPLTVDPVESVVMR